MVDKTACRTPAEGRDGVTNIPTWKFDVLREAILKALDGGDVTFKDLKDAVRTKLTVQTLEELGSLGWHLTSVKLELEVRGEIERVAGASPQLLRRVIT